MKFIHRLGYYGLGLFFGIVILIFFLGGKKTSCDYSPNSRVLKNIRIKEKQYSDEAAAIMLRENIDSVTVSEILSNGKVDFSKSEINREPCNIYYVSGPSILKKFELEIENCDSIATIKGLKIKKGE